MLTVARQSETVLYTSVTIIASGLKEEKDIEFLRNNLNSFLNSTNDATIKGQVKNANSDINTLAMQMIPEGFRDLVDDPVQYLIAEQMVRMG